MSATFDAVVVGLGAMGSAALASLAARGRRVVGLDRFTPPHAFGSSHGKSRIIREAYFEDPRYVPLVQRAYERWADLERECGRTLVLRTGGLMIGPPNGALVAGALESATVHRLPHERLSAAEARAQVPALRVPEDAIAVREPRAGVLFPEACIAAQLERARLHRAEIRCDEPAVAWQAAGDGVEVRTARGSIRAARLVLAAGAWLARLAPELELPLVVTRQALYWFEPAAHPERFAPERFPIFIWEDEPGRFLYGFPDLGDGVKIARHQEGEATDPDRVRREVSAAEIEIMRAALARTIPDAAGRVRETAVCLYTNTPDQHFVVDLHPEHPQVVIASPCSGHGFKFASALGEVLADLVDGVAPEFDLGLFRLERLRTPR
ncbi:MAG TPA: N-methyl-L-tryptophan oxidase [Candidatus Eisenbacteria bacterium]|jgi:sarcosine oxidase